MKHFGSDLQWCVWNSLQT